MTVYVVTGEYVTSRNGDVWWIVGVYGCREDAEIAVHQEKTEQIAMGECVDSNETDEWTVHIELHEEQVLLRSQAHEVRGCEIDAEETQPNA